VDVHSGRYVITDLFSTGVDDSGMVLTDGADDPHYAITSAPAGASTVDRVRTTSAPGGWVNSSTESAWIGPNETDSPPGSYTVDTTFTIPGMANLDSVLITGAWTADNNARNILLNGNSLGISGPGFGSFERFTIGPGAPFQQGTNTLSFVWRNSGSSANLTGFRADDLEGSYIPEPTSLALFVLGGLALMRRRRR
jgi:hypothetical protein